MSEHLPNDINEDLVAPVRGRLLASMIRAILGNRWSTGWGLRSEKGSNGGMISLDPNVLPSASDGDFYAAITDSEVGGAGYIYAWVEQDEIGNSYANKEGGRSGDLGDGHAINTFEEGWFGDADAILTPIPNGTVVRMRRRGRLGRTGQAHYSFSHCPYEMGYGKPASGETDLPPSDTITLTVTTKDGTPILDGNGAEQTIEVWRNTMRKTLYLDFISTDIFCYAKYPSAQDGVAGCIFSRTEGMKVENTYLPSGGIALRGSTAPDAVDATGDYGDDEHVYVTGHFFYEKSSGHGGWKPWFAIDPTLLSDTGFKVKTDADDTTPGFLNDEIIVDPGGGADFWLKKTVDPGGANDNKLLLEHELVGTTAESYTVIPIQSMSVPGTGVIRFNQNEQSFDAAGHDRPAGAITSTLDLTFTSSDGSVSIATTAPGGNGTVDITGAADGRGFETVTTGATTLNKENGGIIEFLTTTASSGAQSVDFSQANNGDTAEISGEVDIDAYLKTITDYDQNERQVLVNNSGSIRWETVAEIDVVDDVTYDDSNGKLEQDKLTTVEVISGGVNSDNNLIEQAEDC